MTARQRTARDALVKEWLPLARKIAGKYSHHSLHEDIFSAASEGLLEAATTYRPGSAAFPTFARYRIYGAIQDYLISEDFLTKHDRRMIRQTGVENPRQPPLSLNIPNEGGLELVDRLCDTMTPDPFEVAAAKEQAARVRLAIEHLSQQQQYVVRQRYWHDRGLKGIGADLGVTESRACQVLHESHHRTRAILTEMAL